MLNAKLTSVNISQNAASRLTSQNLQESLPRINHSFAKPRLHTAVADIKTVWQKITNSSVLPDSEAQRFVINVMTNGTLRRKWVHQVNRIANMDEPDVKGLEHFLLEEGYNTTGIQVAFALKFADGMGLGHWSGTYGKTQIQQGNQLEEGPPLIIMGNLVSLGQYIIIKPNYDPQHSLLSWDASTGFNETSASLLFSEDSCQNTGAIYLGKSFSGTLSILVDSENEQYKTVSFSGQIAAPLSKPPCITEDEIQKLQAIVFYLSSLTAGSLLLNSAYSAASDTSKKFWHTAQRKYLHFLTTFSQESSYLTSADINFSLPEITTVLGFKKKMDLTPKATSAIVLETEYKKLELI